MLLRDFRTCDVYNRIAIEQRSTGTGYGSGQLNKSATSLRPHIVQVLVANQGRILSTEQIYALVSALGMADFDPRVKRDRNLVNRELSDLAGCTTQGHSKPAPQLLTRVRRGHYMFRAPDLPMDEALLREYLEPVEVYEKRPARWRRGGSERWNAPEEVLIDDNKGCLLR